MALSLWFRKPRDLIQALFLRSVQNEETKCIEWQHSIGTDGRPQINIMNRVYRVHRITYFANQGKNMEQINELVGQDISILHTCDNPICINPDHLYRGTRLQNRKDAVERGRVKGGHLSKQDLIEVKEMLKKGISQYKIAERFGVGQPYISRIKSGLRRSNG